MQPHPPRPQGSFQCSQQWSTRRWSWQPVCWVGVCVMPLSKKKTTWSAPRLFPPDSVMRVRDAMKQADIPRPCSPAPTQIWGVWGRRPSDRLPESVMGWESEVVRRGWRSQAQLLLFHQAGTRRAQVPCAHFKGILHQKIFYCPNLIFWIVMGCGIARFGRRGLKPT